MENIENIRLPPVVTLARCSSTTFSTTNTARSQSRNATASQTHCILVWPASLSPWGSIFLLRSVLQIKILLITKRQLRVGRTLSLNCFFFLLLNSPFLLLFGEYSPVLLDLLVGHSPGVLAPLLPLDVNSHHHLLLRVGDHIYRCGLLFITLVQHLAVVLDVFDQHFGAFRGRDGEVHRCVERLAGIL